MNLDALQEACLAHLQAHMSGDPAHDIQHVKRVVKNTIYLTDIEQANHAITVPSAWLHDCYSVPKDSPQRNQASRLAARQAIRFLKQISYPEQHLPAIEHAIEAHSFSAGIETKTLEARIVQDADRLEALGAIGIARCLLTGGSLGSELYHEDDPFCLEREPADRDYAIDHFYAKLFTLPETMKTDAGRIEASRRVAYMKAFLDQLRGEIEGSLES
ncbi:MAG: HD domain-containing protein [Xanthomonadales bacterium]|nr:HD domain-containing protein [Gammaproteobacteria bacterium]NNE05106.1 HD domain-containing protein [Xanthomonadales bacterium]NNL94446.1 HD domain-containing protein [Xanthomonadales bacterium]